MKSHHRKVKRFWFKKKNIDPRKKGLNARKKAEPRPW